MGSPGPCSECALVRNISAAAAINLAGWKLDAGIVQQWIAEVTATRAAAEVQLRDSHTVPVGLTPEQVQGLLEQAGGLVDALDRSDPALHAQLYEELGIDGVYDPSSHTVHVHAELGRRIGRVGGPFRPTRTRRYCGAS